MSKRYHLNPETGNPGVCRPEKTGICRYGSVEHYGSKVEAARAYEERRSSFGDFLEDHPAFTPDTIEEYRREAVRWLDSLDKPELEALIGYANQDYAAINRALWSGEEHPLLWDLDSALAKAPRTKHPRPLYRKPSVEGGKADVAEWLSTLKPGEALEFPGYTSTAHSLHQIGPMLQRRPIPNIFASAEELEDMDETHLNVVFEIYTNRGAPISPLSHMPQELEYLLPRGSRFEVVEAKSLDFQFSRDILTGEERPVDPAPLTVVRLRHLP